MPVLDNGSTETTRVLVTHCQPVAALKKNSLECKITAMLLLGTVEEGLLLWWTADQQKLVLSFHGLQELFN